LIQITKSAELKNANSAALGGLVKFGPWRQRIVRLVDTVVAPIVSALGHLRVSANPDASAEVSSILVVEYWNLGDIVMLSPFLQNLRTQYPKAYIVLLASPKTAPLLAHQNLVDEIIYARIPWAQHYSRWKKYNPFSRLWIELPLTLKLLRKRRFDLGFTARADLRDNFMLWFAAVRRRIGYSFGGGGYFLTDQVAPDVRHPHWADRWLRLLEHLGKPVIAREPHLDLSSEERLGAAKILDELGVESGDFLVGVHPGARSVTRQWGKDNFNEVARRLCDRFPIKIIWFQDPNQESSIQKDGQFLLLSLPLRQFMAVLSQCSLFLCNDSGPMHIATALSVPTVAIFGPGDPAWYGPLGPNNQVVIRPGFWCRSCLDYCLFDQPYCLRAIGVQDVYEASARSIEAMLVRQAQPDQVPT
jgi:heptosyltransferase II